MLGVQTPDKENTMALVPHVDQHICIGLGDCALAAPGVFTVDETALVTGSGSDEQILAAARACPSSAITVTDSENARQIYP